MVHAFPSVNYRPRTAPGRSAQVYARSHLYVQAKKESAVGFLRVPRAAELLPAFRLGLAVEMSESRGRFPQNWTLRGPRGGSVGAGSQLATGWGGARGGRGWEEARGRSAENLADYRSGTTEAEATRMAFG